MKKIIYILSITMILGSCAPLTETQIELVNQFGQTTKDFSAFPSKIMTGLTDIRIKRGLYYANSLSTPELRVRDLDSLYHHANIDFQVSEKVDVTFKIIDKYSQSLVLLSSDKYDKDIEEQAKTFGIGIDSLITLNNSLGSTAKVPNGIGGAIGELILLGGKQYVKTKQAVEIKKFVGLAEPLIDTMTNNLLEYLQSSFIDDLITYEEKAIRRNYLSYLQQVTTPTIEDEKDYLELKNKIDGVKGVRKHTIEATIELGKAHKKLLEEIETKKDLKEMSKQLQKLYEEVMVIREIIKAIENEKK